MPRISRRTASTFTIGVALAATLATAGTALAATGARQISADPYTNTTSWHRTEVEPDSFAFGRTIVTTFQVGRFTNGGASSIGWATSTDAGRSWTHGFLPSLTVYSTPPGAWARASDPSVAYDAKHGVWMISTLPLTSTIASPAVLVSRSTDGLTWGDPVTVASAGSGSDFDKNWTACDNWPTSPHYGNCYTQWDDFGKGNRLKMSTSSDGGLTWTAGTTPTGGVIGGQPLALPDGTVVVPLQGGGGMASFVSTDGGATYTGPFTISTLVTHGPAGGLRAPALPSAEVDGAGRVHVVWADCRFRTGCAANDIVMSTSTDGVTWTAPARVPIDPTTSGIDHFIPGIGVDRSTSGSSARLGLVYYFYPDASCSTTTCQLEVGFVSSGDGGATWSAPRQLAGPMQLGWLPHTSQGYMVGDYVSTSWVKGRAFPVFVEANPGACALGDVTSCDEFAATTRRGLRAGGAVPLDTPPAAVTPGASPRGGIEVSAR